MHSKMLLIREVFVVGFYLLNNIGLNFGKGLVLWVGQIMHQVNWRRLKGYCF